MSVKIPRIDSSIISWEEGWKEIQTNALDVIERHIEAGDSNVRKLFSNAELTRLLFIWRVMSQKRFYQMYRVSKLLQIIKENIFSPILHIVKSEREGQLIEEEATQQKLRHIMKQWGKGTVVDIFEKELESAYIKDMLSYYVEKGQNWRERQQDASVVAVVHVGWVDKVLQEEQTRCRRYLLPSSEGRILQAIVEEFLSESIVQELLLMSSVQGEADNNNNIQLLIFAVLNKDYFQDTFKEKRLQVLSILFQKRIFEEGKRIVEEYLNNLPTASTLKSDTQTYLVISSLLKLYTSSCDIVEAHFAKHTLFGKAIHGAFSDLLNHDDLFILSDSAAELLANYCNHLLRSTTSTCQMSVVQDIESELEHTIALVEDLKEKDLFAEVSRHLLASRTLFSSTNKSYELDILFVNKLKVHFGARFTAKMERMINDITVNKEQEYVFQQFYLEKKAMNKDLFEFSAQVLTLGHWPVFSSLSEASLPANMIAALDIFKGYYNQRLYSSRRRLTWIHSLGRVEMLAVMGSSSYELHLNTLQAAILLLFNSLPSREDLSFSFLQHTLQLPADVIVRLLKSLSLEKCRILIRTSSDQDDSEASHPISSTDRFRPNQSFTSSTPTLRIPMCSLGDMTTMSVVNSSPNLEQDRLFAIEAAIVRVMKVRRQLSHQLLVTEVLNHLTLFKPDSRALKQRIEALIERNYLERDADQPQSYLYVA
eukprot:scaffold2390_cov167-Ochromonas_danica.AAC.4